MDGSDNMKKYSLKFRMLYGLAFAEAFWGVVIGLSERMMEQVCFCLAMAIVVILIVLITYAGGDEKCLKK